VTADGERIGSGLRLSAPGMDANVPTVTGVISGARERDFSLPNGARRARRRRYEGVRLDPRAAVTDVAVPANVDISSTATCAFTDGGSTSLWSGWRMQPPGGGAKTHSELTGLSRT